MNNKKISNPEIDQQVQEVARLLEGSTITDAQKHYLVGVIDGMCHASAAAPAAPAAPEGDSRTA